MPVEVARGINFGGGVLEDMVFVLTAWLNESPGCLFALVTNSNNNNLAGCTLKLKSAHSIAGTWWSSPAITTGAPHACCKG